MASIITEKLGGLKGTNWSEAQSSTREIFKGKIKESYGINVEPLSVMLNLTNLSDEQGIVIAKSMTDAAGILLRLTDNPDAVLVNLFVPTSKDSGKILFGTQHLSEDQAFDIIDKSQQILNFVSTGLKDNS